jgi:amino acid adenylation domain-containing protein
MIGGHTRTVRPATALQRGMLFQAAVAPDSGVYAQQVSFRVDGALDLPRFERAWQHAAARHDALRTSFAGLEDGEISQVVHRSVHLPFQVIDASGMGGRRLLAEYRSRDRRRGFDPAVAPLARVAVFRLRDRRFHVVWSYHHAILDGWSLPIVLGDLFAAYRSESTASALLEQRVESDAYAQWLRSRDGAAAVAFWSDWLAGATPLTPLPGAARTLAGDAAFGRVRARVVGREASAVFERARQCGLTLNTLAHGAWAIVLGRASGVHDVIFGQCLSGRSPDIQNVERCTGLLMNTVPSRVRIAPDQTARQWLDAIQARNLRVRRHEWTPLNVIQSASPIRPPAPLFESVLVFENYPAANCAFDADGLRLSRWAVRGWTDFPLTLSVRASAESLSFTIDYDKRRFARRTAQRLATQTRDALQHTVANLDRRLPLSVVDSIAAVARRLPRATAVTCGDQRYAYDEIDRRSSAAADVLRGAGAGLGGRVGLALPRDADLPVWLLAVLKSGAAFVPLPQSWPEHRLRLVIDAARPQVVVAGATQASRLAHLGVRIINTEEQSLDVAAAPVGLDVPLSAPAYVMFTSGSTGAPKGVLVSHGALAQALASIGALLDLTDSDRIVALTDLSFDISLVELLLPLVSGAMVRVSSLDDVDGVLHASENATCIQTTPTVWAMLLESGWRGGPRVKALCGGEPMPLDLARDLVKRSGRLWNLYGPTEAVIWATAHEVTRANLERGVPIGRPLAHVTTSVLDGELYIGGAALADGYVNAAAVTAERFVPDPTATRPGARRYAAGDRVRERGDGVLEFLGRTDAQLKVHGVRVEPAEIEAALRTHPSIHDAAVLVDGGVLIAACAVGGEWGRIDAAHIRAFAATRLPPHLVPSRIVCVDALPRTSGGKVDRRAISTASAEPRSRTNNEGDQFLRIVESVLGVAVCNGDDFFALGGDSIACLRLVSRLRAAGLQLTAREIFEHSDITELSRLARPIGVRACH